MINTSLLKTLINEKDTAAILAIFEEYNVVNMVEVVSTLENFDIIFLLKILPKNIGGDLFANFDVDKKSAIVENLSIEEIKNVFDNFYSDDIVNLLGELPANLTKKILASTSKETRSEINKLLDYPSETAGAIMTVEFIELKKDDTFKVALEKIKDSTTIAETITESYIIDYNRVLLGKISLKDLFFDDENKIVKDHMETNLISVDTQTNQEEVLLIMQKYDLHVIPVVNVDNCLVGIITIDDILDIMEKEVTKDVLQMAGVSETESSYLSTNIFSLVKARLPWLLVLLLISFVSEFVLKNYININSFVIYAAFIPLIMGSSGNVANQSSFMIIRGFDIEDLTLDDKNKIIFKELLVSLYLSLLILIITLIKLFLLPTSVTVDVFYSVTISIVLSTIFANMIGVILPIISIKLDKDPTFIMAPIITNIIDIIALVIYFVVIKLILKI